VVESSRSIWTKPVIAKKAEMHNCATFSINPQPAGVNSAILVWVHTFVSTPVMCVCVFVSPRCYSTQHKFLMIGTAQKDPKGAQLASEVATQNVDHPPSCFPLWGMVVPPVIDPIM
jgi:hypothetical protein